MNSSDLLTAINSRKNTFAELNYQRITYPSLAKDINRLHHYFDSLSLSPGVLAAVSCRNDYHTTVFFLALLTYGAGTVFIDPEMPPGRAVALLAKSGADYLFMDADLFEARKIDKTRFKGFLEVKEEEKTGKLVKLLLKKKEDADSAYFPAMLNNYSADIRKRDHAAGEDQTAYVIFTSGTTSQPKGVVISRRNLFSHLKTLSRVYRLKEDSRILNILSLYHADGLVQGPLLAAFTGSAWYSPFSFDMTRIGDLFNNLYKSEISHLITVPTVISLLYTYSENYEDSFAYDGFEFVVSVASHLEKDLWGKFESRFKVNIINVYGLTETVAGSLFSGFNPESKQRGSIGVPVDCEARVLTDGREAERGEPGILCLKGEHIFSGYLGDTQATLSVLQDGWLNTGDLVIQDEEGFFTVVGREKNTINSGGFNIYPEQVTEMVNLHEAVQESVSLGFDDPVFGEILVSAVVKKSGKEVSETDLRRFLKDHLEAYQVPKNIVFVAELPKGPSGKVQLQEMREIIVNLPSEVNAAQNSLEIEKTVIIIAAEAFKADPRELSVNTNSKSIDGWDSLAHLVFIVALENKYALRFNTAEMMMMDNLRTVIEIINRKVG